MARYKFSGNRSFEKPLKELQDAFAGRQLSDEFKRMDRRRQRNKTRITRYRGDPIMLKELRELKLRMEGDLRHGQPHLHVVYGKNNRKASYAIKTGERIVGSLDRKHDKAVRAWIGRNRELLLNAWKAITGGDPNYMEVALQLQTAD